MEAVELFRKLNRHRETGTALSRPDPPLILKALTLESIGQNDQIRNDKTRHTVGSIARLVSRLEFTSIAEMEEDPTLAQRPL